MTSKTKTTTPPANVEKAPSVPAPATPIVTIEARDLYTPLKSLLPMAGQDWTLPMINGIHLARRGDRLRFAATDRFVVGMTAVDATWEDAAADDWSMFLPMALCKQILSTWKAAPRGGSTPLTIAAADRSGRNQLAVTVCDPYGTSIGEAISVQDNFPDVEKLVNGGEYLEGEPSDYTVQFDYDYLVKFKSLARGRHDKVKIEWPKEPGRPARIIVGDHSIGVIMPTRIVKSLTVAEILSGGAA